MIVCKEIDQIKFNLMIFWKKKQEISVKNSCSKKTVQRYKEQAKKEFLSVDFFASQRYKFAKKIVNPDRMIVCNVESIGRSVFASKFIAKGSLLGLYPGFVSKKCPTSDSVQKYSIECPEIKNIIPKRTLSAFYSAIPKKIQKGYYHEDFWWINGFTNIMWMINDDEQFSNCYFMIYHDIDDENKEKQQIYKKNNNFIPAVAIIAKKNILSGDEILIDYGKPYFEGRTRMKICPTCKKRNRFVQNCC